MKYFLILFFSISILRVEAQVRKSFPTIETETVKGKKVDFPAAFVNSYTLVGIGMSKKAEDLLRTWQAPVYNKFIAKTGLMDDMFDVDVFFLPVFTGASRAAKGKIVKKLRENNDPLIIDYVYIYSGKRDPFDSINLDDHKKPYFLLIDATGKIVYAAKGEFEQKYLDDIEDLLIDS